ncbi:MAG: putative aminohydrolase SsnA [Deltaproteobacteria bacterium]|nr:putative aminohydrolase SsnA [Deltaproteobacteria bacterium]
MTDTLLVKNGTVVTLGEPNRVLENHSVLCEKGAIKKIGRAAEFKGRYKRTVDASGKVVLPGFINAHMHFYSTMARGLSKAAPSKDFNEVLKNLWWRLDKKLNPDDCYYSALVPMLDAIRHGTTTLIDHHASPFAVRGSLSRIAQAVAKTGLRASLCYEISDRDGRKVAQDGLDENIEFIRVCEEEKNNHLKALVGLHASFTVGDETLKKAAEAGHKLGAGFHVHTAEAATDQEHCLKQHGVRVVERFRRAGILGPKTICAHCVHLNEHEMDTLSETGTAVAHNPQSNMNNAVGVADILWMFRKGVLVGLGTDAMTVNMCEEVRAALWVHRLATNNPSVGFTEALSALLFNNSDIANRYFDPKVGELREGYAADIVCIDYRPPTPFDSRTFLGHFAFGLAHAPVDTTICGGRVLMQKKKLTLDIDEEEVAAKSRELAARLWERF